MPRSRFVSALIVLVLLAAACGGGEDTDAADRSEDAPSAISEMSEDAPRDSYDADSGSEDEQRSSFEPETVAEPVQVRLGDRFDWCAGVQAVWDSHDHAQAVLAAAEARYRDALAAFEAVTDELDRAEAREVLDAAQVDHDQASGTYQLVIEEVRRQLDDARRTQGDETERIAHQRAWLALIAADAEIATLAEIMASQAELKEVAAQLRHAVAQAVAALQDAEEGLQEAIVEVAAERLEAAMAESTEGDGATAMAAAQAAAEAAMRAAEAELADMEAAGALSEEEQQQASQQLEVKREELEGKAAEQGGQSDDGRVVAAQERVRDTEAALGTATAMLRDAEAEAEEYKQQMPEPELALQEALEGIITAGSDAYTAFKLSMRESCEQ